MTMQMYIFAVLHFFIFYKGVYGANACDTCRCEYMFGYINCNGIDLKAFPNFISTDTLWVTEIHMNMNNIKRIDMSQFADKKRWKNLKFIELYENPIECNEISPLLPFVVKSDCVYSSTHKYSQTSSTFTYDRHDTEVSTLFFTSENVDKKATDISDFDTSVYLNFSMMSTTIKTLLFRNETLHQNKSLNLWKISTISCIVILCIIFIFFSAFFIRFLFAKYRSKNIHSMRSPIYLQTFERNI